MTKLALGGVLYKIYRLHRADLNTLRPPLCMTAATQALLRRVIQEKAMGGAVPVLGEVVVTGSGVLGIGRPVRYYHFT